MSRLFKRILLAACWILQAAILLWFWPMMLQDWASGAQARRSRQIKKYWNRHKRRLFDEWMRKENETRHKRVWKNRNNFYKT